MPEETYKPRKLFTLKEANDTLPLVSRIVKDIIRLNGDIQETHALAGELAAEGRSVKVEEAKDRLHDLVHQVAELVDELREIGCLAKGPELGLVDFPARVGSRVVFLCWKYGEEEIRFWHEMDAGYAGRKSVRGVFV